MHCLRWLFRAPARIARCCRRCILAWLMSASPTLFCTFGCYQRALSCIQLPSRNHQIERILIRDTEVVSFVLLLVGSAACPCEGGVLPACAVCFNPAASLLNTSAYIVETAHNKKRAVLVPTSWYVSPCVHGKAERLRQPLAVLLCHVKQEGVFLRNKGIHANSQSSICLEACFTRACCYGLAGQRACL
jgi:hypothetical protein